MRRWVVRLLLAVVVVATGWFVLDRMVLEPRETAKVQAHAAELAELVAAEVEAFNSRMFERDALTGEPVEGDAVMHYRVAFALMEESGVDRDLLSHLDAGDSETPRILDALAPAFEALARGTRARTVGVFLPVLGPGEETDLVPAARLVELLLFAAALDFDAGRAARGLDRVEVALRVGRDLTMARPWDVQRQALCELPIEVLGKGVATRRLGPTERTRAIGMLREDLASRPHVWDAFRAPVLEVQVLLAGYFRGPVTYEQLATELPLPPRENRWLGFVREGPTDRELLAGWCRLRKFLPEFEAEAGKRPATFATWATREVQAYAASRPPVGESAVVTPGLLWAAVTLWEKGKKLAEEQAVLIALRLLDAYAATGALPSDLTGMIDPEAETRFPGAVWAYRKDDAGRPSLFCELEGNTHLAQASRLVPVFSFR